MPESRRLQVFHPATNTLARVSILLGLLLLAAAGWLINAIVRSSYATQVNVVRDQPVSFSHEHHVGQLGIDCRYCHATVETAAFAGMPSTETCMGCHSQIWSDSPMLEPVRASFRENRPIRWTRVHDLPDFVRFDHSIHVSRGVACSTCHGSVEEMPLMWRARTLHMDWCLDCHRHPTPIESDSFSAAPAAGEDGLSRAGSQVNIRPAEVVPATKQLTNCSTCHQ